MTNLLKQVVIVGGGPAGLSAALWADDLGLDTVLFESGKEIGGQLQYTYNPITNYLGCNSNNGSELSARFAQQLLEKPIRIIKESKIAGITSSAVFLQNGQETRFEYLILATGVSRRDLNVPGETEFQGKGILHSGKRDGAMAAGHSAAVIGGGDAAFENALLLTEFADQVSIIHRSDTLRARAEFVEKAAANRKIKILTGFEVSSFEGSDRLEGLVLRDTSNGSETNLEVMTAVVRIGVKPNTEIVEDLVRLDAGGYVEIDNECKTSEPSIYAVGDVANPISPTISSAAGMGATAVKSIAQRILRR